MKRSEIEAKVKSLFASELGIDTSEIQGHEKLTEELGLDSLDLLAISEALEEMFDLTIPDSAFF
jgi:acyl carrier protein